MIILELLDIVLKKCLDLKQLLAKSSVQQQALTMKIAEMLHNLPEVNHVITLRQNLVVKRNEDSDNEQNGKDTFRVSVKFHPRNLKTLPFIWETGIDLKYFCSI